MDHFWERESVFAEEFAIVEGVLLAVIINNERETHRTPKPFSVVVG